MSINTGIPGGPCQIFILPVRDVLQCLSITIFLRQSEIDYIENTGFLAESHQKILWLDVSVDVGLGVHILDPLYQLVGKH